MGFSVHDSAGRLKVTPQLVNLASEVSGVLSTAHGGTSVDITSAALPLGSGQITFPASQNPSADANTLDDYEEGAWTPGDGSGAALSLTVVSARYVKLGNLVFVAGDIVYPITANGANARINGLPFTSHGVQQSSVTPGYLTFGASITYLIRNGNTIIDIFTTAGVNVTNAQISNTNIILAGCYVVPV